MFSYPLLLPNHVHQLLQGSLLGQGAVGELGLDVKWETSPY